MNKQRLIVTSVISIFLVALLLMGSTYSIFTSQEIDDNTNVYTTGNLNITYQLDTANNIKFTDITPYTFEDANCVKPYRITVTNNGNVPYMFDLILTDTTSSEENTIDYQYIMTKVGYLETKSLSNCNVSDLGGKYTIIKENIILPAGESVDIDVRIWISDTIQNTEMGKSFYSKLTIDGLAIYNDNTDIDNSILSLRYMTTSTKENIRSSDYVEKIKNVSFVDYIDTSNAALNSETNENIMWDMSTKKDKSVVAWLEDNEITGYYNLYIGSNYSIYANNLSSLFNGMEALENVNFNNLDTSLTESTTNMFSSCSSLINLDVSKFNTSNVTSMSKMFYNCKKLQNLDVSNFETSNVTNMGSMFYGCENLTSLNVSSFDFSSVTEVGQMFKYCRALTSLNLSNLTTSLFTSMSYMFEGCSSLKTLNLSNFNMNNITNITQAFMGCSVLEKLYLNSADFSNITTYTKSFTDVPTTINIYVKDETQATWLTGRFTDLTNVIY